MNDSLPPELAAIADLLRRAARDEAPPPQVLARVLALDSPSSRLKQSSAALLRRLIAVVVSEGSGPGFAPAWGVRGAMLADGQWLFRAEDFEIDLRAARKGEAWSLAGQLFGMPDAERVVLEGPVPSATVVLGPTHEFRVRFAGRWKLPPDGAGWRSRGRDSSRRHRRVRFGVNDSLGVDELAAALMAAAPEARSELLRRGSTPRTPAFAWALKRASDAAWSTQPANTVIAAGLVEELAEIGADPKSWPWPHGREASLTLAQGQLEAGLEALDRAVEGFHLLGQPLTVAQIHISRLMALAMLGRYDDAIACGLQARAVFDDHGDGTRGRQDRAQLGNLAARREQHDDARRHYRQALARFSAAGDTELRVMATKGLASILAQRHEFEAAEPLYREAQTSAKTAGLAVLSALVERDLGALLLKRGRYDQALPSLGNARTSLAGLDLPHELALAEEWLGDAYLELNLLPEALALYQSSLASYEAAGAVTDRAWALSQRGRALTLLGRYRAAAESLELAEQAFSQEGNATGAALVRLWEAELALKRGDTAAAIEHTAAAEPALASVRQLSAWLQARLLRADALRIGGDAAQAELLALAARASADERGLAPAQRRALILLGMLARDRGEMDGARQCFEAAVESIESQRGMLPSEEFRAAFLGYNLLPYQEMVRLSLMQADADRAERSLHWVERARARALADTLDANPDDIDSTDPARRENALLRSQLNACYRAMAQPGDEGASRWLDEARSIEAELLEAGRRDALGGASPRSSAGPPALDLAALHGRLGDHSALVEYFTVDDDLKACVVAGGQAHVLHLPLAMPAVRAAVEQLRFQTDTLRRGTRQLAHRMPELRQRALHHLQGLHVVLWAPLLPLLGDRRAVVVPHGPLHYLPFEALHDGQRHEIERREFCRVPSAVMFLRSEVLRPGRWESALVLGHADERLPLVRAEVEAVAACFAQSSALQGGEATGEALRKAGDHDVLHIACHAQFRNDSPRFSALHLADGAFTVRDASSLRLGGKLVTLSACETAISAVLPGDELIGLTHAFISAGAARVVASLWTVQDDAAAAFMPRFYGRLRGGMPPAQALRLTQVETLAERPHPYFWSAFTLHGGW